MIPRHDTLSSTRILAKANLAIRPIAVLTSEQRVRYLSTPPKRIEPPLHLPDPLRIHGADNDPLRIGMKEFVTPDSSEILQRDNLPWSTQDHDARAILVAHAGAGARRERHHDLDASYVEAQAGLVADLEQAGG